MVYFVFLAPFATLAFGQLVLAPLQALLIAAAVALAALAYDVLRGRSAKALVLVTLAAFLALAGYIALVDRALAPSTVRVTVEAIMLALALGSLILRKPFTLQYAREAVDAETARLPGFHHANAVITSAWGFAFVLMLSADVVALAVPALPVWTGLAVAALARNAAVLFTRWYPQYRIAAAAAAAAR